MRIKDLIEKFTISCKRDIAPNFKLVKTLEIDLRNSGSCLNCGAVHNCKSLPASSWSALQHCSACNSLNVIYYQDRMSGAFKDIVEIYQEKTEEVKEEKEINLGANSKAAHDHLQSCDSCRKILSRPLALNYFKNSEDGAVEQEKTEEV